MDQSEILSNRAVVKYSLISYSKHDWAALDHINVSSSLLLIPFLIFSRSGSILVRNSSGVLADPGHENRFI